MPSNKKMAAAADWCADDNMTPFEALMWRAEVNPLLRSNGIVMEVLDGPPERERVVAAHEWATRLLPRLRDRVVEDPLGLASPRWVTDRDFDLSYHLRFVRLPDPGAMEQVFEIAQVLAMAPCDRSRPPWEAVLVEGLADGKAVYLFKIHHSITDGEGTVQMLDIVHSTTPEPGHARDLPVPVPERISGRELAARNLLGVPRRAPRDAVKLGGRIASMAAGLASGPPAITSSLDYIGSLARMVGSPPARRSVLLEQRSLGRRFGAAEVPLAELRAAGKAAGGTLNDAFLAAITGGMRRYHAEHGVEIAELPLALPVSTRKEDDPMGANRFGAGRIAIPTGMPDVHDRIRVIGERVRAVRDEPALGFMDTMAPALSRLPSVVSATMTERVTRSIDVQASNVRGLDREAYFAGSKVLRTFAFGPAPGCALMVTLISYNGTCCIAVTLDVAAVPDYDVFMRCLQDGFDEVAALASAGQRPPAKQEAPEAASAT
jgi:WS/DGAT/MGAT family acyltransferase